MSGYNLPSRSLVSQQDSALIQRPDVPRSKFTGSWSRKTAFDAGLLVPFMCDEILPGDHMRYNVTSFVRMATPLFPMFDNQRIDTFFFFVPNRLVWENWKKFMGEQATPASSIAFVVPQVADESVAFTVGSIWDHFGIPTTGQWTTDVQFSILPFRAYNLIYNEWFRDENLINSAAILSGDGPDAAANYSLLRRAKSHDYFTSALPWPQKFTAPSVALGGVAPVRGVGYSVGAVQANLNVTEPDGSVVNYPNYVQDFDNNLVFRTGNPLASPPLGVYADLTAATGVSINTFRQAFLVQQLLERDARGGTRYTELVRSHFGVTSPDARFQRPEYIGGGSSPLTLTPVAQTAPTAGLSVGSLGAAGNSVGSHSASYAATEHGFIIGLINVKTELSYQQGLHRMWTRLTRHDYYWPSLAGLGEQAILVRELFATGNPANDDLVFGYQERWHEYRTRTSEVAGIFRSTAAGTLDAWHLAQRFLVAPTLGQTFIEDNPPMARVLAAGALAAGQQYLADILISREATRAIPSFGTPAALGRF